MLSSRGINAYLQIARAHHESGSTPRASVERRIRLLRVGRKVIRLGLQNLDIHGV